MYSDKVEVLRFETEPYRKQLDHHNGSPHKNGALNYNNNNNNNSINNHHVKFIYQNGYHNHSTTLIETETKSTAVTTQLQVQSPSDPAIASVLHPRHTPRPGRILLENVNNRPQTMDRGTQANTATTILDTNDTPSTSNEPTNNELYRNANISVNNQKLLSSGGVSSSADSLNSADSAKRDNEDSVHESVESNQPMISKDNTDGHPNMSNGDGKFPGIGCDKPSNGIVKEYPVEDDADKTSCGMECLYFAMQCCECTIM